jgi:hypothetical protein
MRPERACVVLLMYDSKTPDVSAKHRATILFVMKDLQDSCKELTGPIHRIMQGGVRHITER